ncbi:MAG: hypothetical protein RL215_1634, partial [Planctomycetota bacterium]
GELIAAGGVWQIWGADQHRAMDLKNPGGVVWVIQRSPGFGSGHLIEKSHEADFDFVGVSKGGFEVAEAFFGGVGFEWASCGDSSQIVEESVVVAGRAPGAEVAGECPGEAVGIERASIEEFVRGDECGDV